MSEGSVPDPRVTILLFEDIAINARARRGALALSSAGIDVTVLAADAVGGTSVGSRDESWIGRVRVIRLGMRSLLRDTRDARRRRRRAWMPRPVYRDAAEVAAAEARLELRRLSVETGRLRLMSGVLLAAGRLVVGSRRAGHRLVDAARRRGWHDLDRVTGRVTAGVSWRRVLPEANDFELVFGPELDLRTPDLIHAHGVVALGVAARASARARLRGCEVPWLYDAQENVNAMKPRAGRTARVLAAYRNLEAEYVYGAAKVLAVDDVVAQGLRQRYGIDVDVVGDLKVGVGSQSWRTDTERLVGIYRHILGPDRVASVTLTAVEEAFERSAVSANDTGGIPVVGIGPANMAGQAWAWAKALERYAIGLVRTDVLMVDRGSPLIFEADELVPAGTYARDVTWQERTRDRILRTWTHALLEAGRPVMGTLFGRTFANDARVMADAGIRVALVFHGSELRDPRRHALTHRWSPFQDPSDPWVSSVQATVDLLRPQIDEFSGPCLLSTPDLLDDLPHGRWLPVVVDVTVWTPGPPVLERPVPVVVHAPSRAAIKGSSFVDEAVAPLVADGLIEYRRIESVAPDQMPGTLKSADIVLDQFAIGSYGVLAVQAMAAGRVVLGDVSDQVRDYVEGSTGETVPILQATPENLRSVLRELLRNRDVAHRSAQAGPAFVASVHDGTRSAAVLMEALELRPVPEVG
jgi:hypothetical protein